MTYLCIVDFVVFFLGVVINQLFVAVGRIHVVLDIIVNQLFISAFT